MTVNAIRPMQSINNYYSIQSIDGVVSGLRAEVEVYGTVYIVKTHFIGI